MSLGLKILRRGRRVSVVSPVHTTERDLGPAMLATQRIEEGREQRRLRHGDGSRRGLAPDQYRRRRLTYLECVRDLPGRRDAYG